MFSKRFLAFLACVVACAAPGEPPSYESLAAKVQRSFEGNPLQDGGLLQQLVREELEVDNQTTDGDDLVRIKYLMSHWRNRTRDRLVQQALGSQSAFATALGKVAELGALLRASDVRRLAARYRRWPEAMSPDEFYRILVGYGDPGAVKGVLPTGSPWRRRLVPALRVKNPPIDPHPVWGADRWLGIPGMDAYEWKGSAVVIRGREYRHGDQILVDLAKAFDGLNTSFSEPRSGFTHNGTVVFLHHGGRTIPVVFEIHSVGLRVVPLARYVSPEFIYYAEVYRPTEAAESPGWADRLEALVWRLLKDQLGYDFNAEPIPAGGYEAMIQCGRNSVVCSSLSDLEAKTLGLGVEIAESEVHPGMRPNLAQQGLTLLSERGRYLTPTDIKRAKGFLKVGTIDNGLEVNLAREWIMGSPKAPGSLGDWLTHRRLAIERLPFFKGGAVYRGVRRLAKVLQAKGRFGRWGRAITDAAVGLNERTMPQASPKVLATVVAFNNRLERAVRQMAECPEILATLSSDKPLDLLQVEVTPAAQAQKAAIFKSTGLDQAFEQN